MIPGRPLLPQANWWGIFKFALSPTDSCTIPKSKKMKKLKIKNKKWNMKNEKWAVWK